MRTKRFHIDCLKEEVYDRELETWVIVPYYRLSYRGEELGSGYTKSFRLIRLQARGVWMIPYVSEDGYEEDEYDGSI